MNIRDRIVRLDRVKASDLTPHPRNWRTHPPEQRRAVAAALEEIGFADALLVRQNGDGYQIIDGHLRAEITAEMEVPVLVLDLDDVEAEKLLMTLDPLAAMATRNDEQLAELVASVEFDNEALDELVAAIGDPVMPDFQPTDEEPPRLDEKTPVTCPECGHEFTP